MQRFYQPLYYSSVLNKSPACERYQKEVVKIGFNNYESKRTLEVFEDWAYLLWNTSPEEEQVRKRLLFGILKRRNFKFTAEKKNEDNHVMVRFFNLLVRFYGGDDSAYEGLVNCLDISSFYESFDFKWID